MKDNIKRVLTVVGATLTALWFGAAAFATPPDPESIAVSTATSLKDSLLEVFEGVAPVALLVMVAVFGILFGVKLVRRFAR